jgi:hypothetical protein
LNVTAAAATLSLEASSSVAADATLIYAKLAMLTR